MNNIMTNCPNCGAPITSSQCEYCGTSFDYLQKEIDILAGKTKLIERQNSIENLYTAALMAMRNFASSY